MLVVINEFRIKHNEKYIAKVLLFQEIYIVDTFTVYFLMNNIFMKEI